ncbi:DUF1127 domain-containing protein [uncultured Jannaschia sp.]|uniref:DUF1127 domain-containing protein n=1 Tax=uncultured Jannaschia sp. TaxID=293347 RepID=UPI0026075252|nr:DUF1127 domain-containing protein [uncultured Jannaschia sp.]
MAYAINGSTSSFGSLLRGNIAARLNGMRAELAKRRVYRTTQKELSALSDRDLADLGISRASIRAISLEAAYGQ